MDHIKLNVKEYEDKVKACWIGKNIGGTMGTPYEGKREMQDIKGFVTAPGEVLPNDDLDLQLAWLLAAERFGMQMLDANKLGEFWLSTVTPFWNEYGIGKTNMMSGLLPPLSGDYHNDWKNSNGAWIRTEIWACLNPARPDVAIYYAVEDAIVDHGTGEGTYAAAFVAAMQSAAFVLSDIRACIDVALSKIPDTTRIYKTIKLVIDCYDKKTDYREARNIIQQSNADLGDGWFEAPSNVGYAVLGLLYGKGDFKKSMIYAINCGDDTDCTGATVGATLGILYGMKGIPSDWAEYIGDKIETISISKGVMHNTPKTCTELTERVVKLCKATIEFNEGFPNDRQDQFDFPQRTVFVEGKTEIPEDVYAYFGKCIYSEHRFRSLLPNAVDVKFNFATATASAPDGIDIAAGETRKVEIYFRNAN
ncbi:MAG: ADP-ribosylglycohydrolase family protein, partial [Clostridia bacterium]|nr:ADP-ribosylglycohydrolase family protein [Clostridia bacterium]